MLTSDLKNHYTHLWEETKQKWQAGTFELDPLIDSPEDRRRGLTLVIRPNAEVKDKMQAFLQELQLLEPEQYYYPVSDLHVTVMSVISCYPDFHLDAIPLHEYVALMQQILEGLSSFTIKYQGITASPSAVLAQGFPSDQTLNQLRDRIRTIFRNSGLQQSMDTRYTIQTAHITLLRFRKPLRNPAVFLQKLEALRNYSFGTSPITQAELVYNDWYQRQEHVQTLARFPFPTNQ